MDKTSLQITARLLVQEAEVRGWRVEIIDAGRGLIRYHHPDGRTYTAVSLTTRHSSGLANKIADDKLLLFRYLQTYGISLLDTEIYTTTNGPEFLSKYGKIVVKPRRDTAHGDGVSVGVGTLTELEVAVGRARTFGAEVIMQPMLIGEDFRLLYIGGKLAAAAIRRPAAVVGDGVHSLQELIALENQNPARGTNYQTKLNKIDAEVAASFLGEAINEVPASGEYRAVIGTANIGTGGASVDVTDTVDQQIVQLGQQIVQTLQMPVCGVDFINDTTRGPKLIEINASPSLGLHAHPHEGIPQPVASIYLDWLETTSGDNADDKY